MTKSTKFILSISVLWVVYVIYAYSSAFFTAKHFEYYLEGDCPSMNIHVLPPKLAYATVSSMEWVELIAWYDKKTDEEIYITSESARKYLAVQNCTRQKFNAFIKRESAARDKIQPELRVKYGYFFSIVFLPIALLLLLVAFPIFVIRKRSKG